MAEKIYNSKCGFLTSDYKVFRYKDGEPLEVTNIADLMFDGVNYMCPLCSSYVAKRLAMSGEIVCKKCKETFGVIKGHLLFINQNKKLLKRKMNQNLTFIQKS